MEGGGGVYASVFSPPGGAYTLAYPAREAYIARGPNNTGWGEYAGTPGKTVSIEVLVKYLLSGVVLPTFSTTLPVREMDLGIELSTRLSSGFYLFEAESTF